MKRLLLILFVVFFTLSNSFSRSRRFAPLSYFSSHAYAGLSVGTNVIMSEGYRQYSPLNNLGHIEKAFIGYSFAPLFSLKASAGISTLYWMDINEASHEVVPLNSQMATLDALFNLSSLFYSTKTNASVDISLYVGAGLANRNKGDFDSNVITPLYRAGLQFDYPLSPSIKLNVNAEINAANDNFNGFVIEIPYDIFPALSIGLSFDL